MIEIEKPKIETEILSEDGTHGKFVVEPLERGQQPKTCAAFISTRCCSNIY